jgi:glutamate racemase
VDARPIGVFDSGVGGLTVVSQMRRMLPGESIVYFGDLARLPYGSKSKQSIIQFSHQIMRFLLGQDVKAVIIACGTASSNSLEEMRASYSIPIMGVVEPGAHAAANKTRNKRIGVIGTEATVSSGAYGQLLAGLDPEIQVFSKACPLFVPLVEEGWFDDGVTREVIHRYLIPLKEEGVDTLILGCTHYPLLRGLIQEEMGEQVTLVDPSQEAALLMKSFLISHQRLAENAEGSVRFYASDSTEKFQRLAEVILDSPMMPVKRIAIENY